MENKEFDELMLACIEIATDYPEGIVYIGGIAVYLHSVNTEETKALAEFTHDADFYISLADMADLRDIEEVTANRRLSKHQLVKRGFEFDIYTERHANLLVPYDQVLAHSVTYDKIKVSSLEHLLVLKLEAYRDRAKSSKGQKDAKDIIRIGLISSHQKKELNPDLCLGYLSEDHLILLKAIQKSPEFMALSKGNAKLAKGYRDKFTSAIKELLGNR